jgi:tetratricopeptide (TPR) repeat protein
MENMDEIREARKKAEELIDRAENFMMEGKTSVGFNFYKKATNVYFKTGDYMKIPDLLIRVSTLMKKESTIIQAMEYLRKILKRLKELDLPEEQAKILMVLGNLSRQVGDYDSAANFYEDCAEYYLKAEPEEYRGPSAMFLLRTAEMYSLMKKHEKAERIVILGALRLNPDTTDFQAEEEKAKKLLREDVISSFKETIPIYKFLLDYFKKSLTELSDIGVQIPGLKDTLVFAETRLIHIISEYRLILMLIHEKIGLLEESKAYALESIEHLNSAIDILKNQIKNGNWQRTDLKRLTYIGFMRAYFQKFHHIKNPSPEDQIQHYITRDLPDEVVKIIKDLPYYDLCVKTETYVIEDIDDELKEFHLGRLEKYKILFNSYDN